MFKCNWISTCATSSGPLSCVVTSGSVLVLVASMVYYVILNTARQYGFNYVLLIEFNMGVTTTYGTKNTNTKQLPHCNKTVTKMIKICEMLFHLLRES